MLAELIVERTDHTKEHMGLIIWADAPEKRLDMGDFRILEQTVIFLYNVYP